MVRKKRKDFAVSFKEKCYVINKYEKNRKKEENAMRKMLFFMVKNNINCGNCSEPPSGSLPVIVQNRESKNLFYSDLLLLCG